MNRILNLLLFFLLVSCTQIAPTEIPVVPNTEPAPTSTPFPRTSSPPTAAPTVTPTVLIPEITCDPFSEDFCITDGHFIFQRPIHPSGNDSADTTYGYGSTANGTREPHHGVEFLNRFGTLVYAAADGVVIFAGSDDQTLFSPWPNFYGDLVVIKHDDGLHTLYAHLSRIDVRAAQDVRAGDKVGEVGQTGVATGSHLHFEVRRGDVYDYSAALNPELWLLPKNDKSGLPLGALMLSVIDADHHFQFVDFTASYHLDPTQPILRMYYGIAYASEMATGEENAALADLAPGAYRLALKYNGQIYERWVEVESGRLTQVVFVVK